MLCLPLGFNPPRIGSTVFSIGYTDFAPADGIPVSDVVNGMFDWARDYRHRLVVTEGKVERIFTQRSDGGYCRGPSFAFNNHIAHGQSGGPVVSQEGVVVGINTGDVTSRFGRPMSLASMLYPMLLTGIRFGTTLGGANFKINLNANRHLVELVTDGVISSDGSEQHVGIHAAPDGEGWAVGPRIPIEDREFVHDDFHGFQDRRVATPLGGEVYRIRRVESPEDPPA